MGASLGSPSGIVPIYIFLMGYWFKMARIHTALVHAKVVKKKSIWNRADLLLIHPPMGHHGRTPDSFVAVPCRVNTPLPIPTTRFRVNLIHRIISALQSGVMVLDESNMVPPQVTQVPRGYLGNRGHSTTTTLAQPIRIWWRHLIGRWLVRCSASATAKVQLAQSSVSSLVRRTVKIAKGEVLMARLASFQFRIVGCHFDLLDRSRCRHAGGCYSTAPAFHAPQLYQELYGRAIARPT